MRIGRYSQQEWEFWPRAGGDEGMAGTNKNSLPSGKPGREPVAPPWFQAGGRLLQDRGGAQMMSLAAMSVTPTNSVMLVMPLASSSNAR